MQIKNRRQIFIALIAVLISVTLVAVAVYATTTVGNDVTVGGSLTVLDEAAFNGADISEAVGVSSQGGYGVYSVALGKATTSATTTCAVFAQVPIGVIVGEPQDYYNACLAGYDGSVNYGLSIEASSSETVIDILLQNGGTISNATDGIIALTGQLSVSGTSSFATTTIGGGTAIEKILFGTADVNPASINATSSGSATTSVTGAVSGMRCFLEPPTNLDDDLVPKGCAAGSGMITVYLYNGGVAAVDDSTTTWGYLLIK